MRAVLIRLAQHQIGVLLQDLQKTKVSSRNEFFCSKKFNRLLKDRPQVLELVEQVPDVIASAFLAMRMQVRDSWIAAVRVESCLRRPFDEDHHRARFDVASGRLAKLAERDNVPSVGLHFLRGAARIGEILVTVRNVKEIECVYRTGHRSLQVIVTSTYANVWLLALAKSVYRDTTTNFCGRAKGQMTS